MKFRKVLAMLLVALLISSVAFAATPGRDQGHGRGDVAGNAGRYDWDPQKTFRLVRYVPSSYSLDSATIVTESIMVWDKTSDDGVTVTTTTTSYDSAVAGIIVQQALTPTTADAGNTAKQDYAKRNWTWLQTYGQAEVRVGDGAVAAGDAMACNGTAGEAGTFLGGTVAGAQGNAGFFYDASAKALDDVEVFIRCE